MAVWTGWGALVPLTVIVCQTAAILAFMLAGAPPGFAWAPVAAGGAAAGLAIYFLEKRVRARGGDPGAFFFVKTSAWAYIVPAMTLLMAIGVTTPGGLAR